MKPDSEIIDLRDFPDQRLLERLHAELYLPNFPIPEQQEDPAVWAPLLWGPLLPPPKPILHILLAGEHLRDDKRRLFGFIICEFFRRSRCGLLTYLAVGQAVRGRGIGRRLFTLALETLHRDAQTQGEALGAVFGETNVPQGETGVDHSFDAGTRMAILSGLGARHLPIRYVQPALGPGKARSTSLLLIAFPIDGRPLRSLPSDLVVAFLREFYQSLGIEEPEGDHDFAAMLEGLRAEAVMLEPLVPG